MAPNRPLLNGARAKLDRLRESIRWAPSFHKGRQRGRAARRLGLLALASAVLVLTLSACVSQVARDGGTTSTPVAPTATPNSLPTVPAPTSSPTLRPSPTPVPSPNPSPGPSPVPGLTLQVRAPANGTNVPGSAVVVFGLTSPGALVTVDGRVATVDSNGGFRAEAELNPGINTIEIVASDGAGNEESATVRVTSLALPPQPFLLLITEPQDQSIVTNANLRLAGRTGPLAIVSVNGVSVAVDPFGTFSTFVILESGPNIIDVVATNDDGQVLSTVVAVIYRPTPE